MNDENRYIKQGYNSILDDHGIEEEEEWDFEKETWGIEAQHVERPFACVPGIQAALDELGNFESCYKTRLEFHRPKIPIDSPEKLLGVFPEAFRYPDWTTWILGFENFVVNRETGCREVDLFVQSDHPREHLVDPPEHTLKYRFRYFVLETVEIPEWIEEHM